MPKEVVVPPLGANVDVLTLISWYKQEGENVVKDEPLFSVQTDKAALDVEAPATGILCQVSAQPGSLVPALSRIAFIAAPGETLPSTPSPAFSLPLNHSMIPHQHGLVSPSPVLGGGGGGLSRAGVSPSIPQG